MLSHLASALVAGALLAGIVAGTAHAHEGHDHGAPAAASPASVAARGEAASENFELVAVAQGAELIIYLDRFASNEPAAGAAIEVETPEGPAKAEAKDDGTYRLPAPWLAKGGRLDLVFTVAADNAVDILPVAIDVPADGVSASRASASLIERARALLTPSTIGALLAGVLIGAAAMAFARRRAGVAMILIGVALTLASAPALAHEGHDHAEEPKPAPLTGDRAARLGDGTIFIPKPVQRIFGLRTILTEAQTFKRAIELPGRIIPDPNASGYVQAAVGGRLTPPPGGFPQLGAQVKQGDVLAYVAQPMQTIDVSDMRQRQGELDQQIAIVERRLARQETLVPSGAIARSQLEDTRSELEGLRERRGMLDKSRREPEALIAPVSGVIADGSAIAGQIAQPNAVIFHVIDPARLWVEALSFEIIPEAREAFAQTASGRTFTLMHRGSGFADRSQSIPVHFEIEGNATGLRAGQFVSVLVRTDDASNGIAVPRSALVRAAGGQDVIFEHVSAERFVARIVRTAPLDGASVLVLAGIEPGKRVVTQGAELLDHVR
jgi:RND family efflux transporter MFP subunit